MTREEIQAWIGFRFSEWAILRHRDGDSQSFSAYLKSVDGSGIGDWSLAYWEAGTE